MTAAAYIYADGGPISQELFQLSYIREFGVEGAMGKSVLGFGEMRRMKHAEAVINAYHSRKASMSWDAWAKDRPHDAELLFDAQQWAKEIFDWDTGAA